MDVAQRPLGVRVQGPGVGRIPSDVRFDGGVKPLLPQLAEDHGPELQYVQRGGAQGDQRLIPRLPELLARRPRNPLGQHRQRAACLLELRQRPPR